MRSIASISSLGVSSYDTPTMAVGNGTVFVTTSPLRPPAPGRAGSRRARARRERHRRRGGWSAGETDAERGARGRHDPIGPRWPVRVHQHRAGSLSDCRLEDRVFERAARGSAGPSPSRRPAPTAELTLTPWSTVTGRVVDESGEPVQGASLQLLRPQFQDGRRRLVSAGHANERRPWRVPDFRCGARRSTSSPRARATSPRRNSQATCAPSFPASPTPSFRPSSRSAPVRFNRAPTSRWCDSARPACRASCATRRAGPVSSEA